MKKLLLLSLVLVLVSCSENHFREGKTFAGNKYVSAKTLNLGKSTYEEYCFACHGLNGNGMGVAAKGLYPPVRNFKPGAFKFSLTMDGEMPHDDQLKRIIRYGLNGTAMLPWDISDERLDAVVQYIKTFAPEVWEGKDKELGKKIVLDKDPYGEARKIAAIEKGKGVYHFTAQCTTCHRGYIGLEEYNSLAKKYESDRVPSFDEEYFKVKPQDSDYGAKIIPPDFTWHHIRSAQTVHDLAYRIAAGVGGVMPTWKESIKDEEIWALAYYVRDLMDLRRTPGRQKLIDSVK